MEDDQNGGRPKWKTTKMEDDQIERQPKWKTTKKEDDQHRIKAKMENPPALPVKPTSSRLHS